MSLSLLESSSDFSEVIQLFLQMSRINDEMRIVYLVLLNDQPNLIVQRLEIKENKTEIVALALLNKHNTENSPPSQ